MLRDLAFFSRPKNTASRGRGEGKNWSATKFRKNAPQVWKFSHQFCSRLYHYLLLQYLLLDLNSWISYYHFLYLYKLMKESSLIQCCQQTQLSFCFWLFLPPFFAWQEINLFISDFLLTGDSFLHTNTDGNAIVFRSLLRFAKDNLKSSHLKCLEQTNVCLVTWKYSPTSLRMATINLLNIFFFWKLEIWTLVPTFHITFFSTFWYTAVLKHFLNLKVLRKSWDGPWCH